MVLGNPDVLLCEMKSSVLSSLRLMSDAESQCCHAICKSIRFVFHVFCLTPWWMWIRVATHEGLGWLLASALLWVANALVVSIILAKILRTTQMVWTWMQTIAADGAVVPRAKVLVLTHGRTWSTWWILSAIATSTAIQSKHHKTVWQVADAVWPGKSPSPPFQRTLLFCHKSHRSVSSTTQILCWTWSCKIRELGSMSLGQMSFGKRFALILVQLARAETAMSSKSMSMARPPLEMWSIATMASLSLLSARVSVVHCWERQIRTMNCWCRGVRHNIVVTYLSHIRMWKPARAHESLGRGGLGSWIHYQCQPHQVATASVRWLITWWKFQRFIMLFQFRDTVLRELHVTVKRCLQYWASVKSKCDATV